MSESLMYAVVPVRTDNCTSMKLYYEREEAVKNCGRTDRIVPVSVTERVGH